VCVVAGFGFVDLFFGVQLWLFLFFVLGGLLA
jgi:hypothetical protein